MCIQNIKLWDSQISRIWTQNYSRDHLWNVGCSDSINPCVYAIHKVVGPVKKVGYGHKIIVGRGTLSGTRELSISGISLESYRRVGVNCT